MVDAPTGWRANIIPALVVVLISVPLSMGIAIASGVPPVSGLVTAIVGGIVIGALAGSPIQISGPSAGLAVMVLEIVNGRGIEALAIIAVLMGSFRSPSDCCGWDRCLEPFPLPSSTACWLVSVCSFCPRSST